jgi:tRNA pseudouridine55 synthase
VASAAQAFVGTIRQTPPMYSAVHHEGRRLYELAREGVEVPREAREVTVHAIAVDELRDAAATLRVTCGKGTYVRTLVADLGEALGVGAAVERLQRLRVGPFTLADAVTSAELRDMPLVALNAHIASPAAALRGWPEIVLDADRESSFRHGRALEAAQVPPGFVRVHDTDGALVGIGTVDGAARLRPVRILHADRSDARVLPA